MAGIKYWDSIPREDAKFPSLEILRMTIWSPEQSLKLVLLSRSLDYMTLKGPYHPNLVYDSHCNIQSL